MKPKKFTVSLNTSFFDCARCVHNLYTSIPTEHVCGPGTLVHHDNVYLHSRCCGAQIIGCYAPNGEHCERPLEVRTCTCTFRWCNMA